MLQLDDSTFPGAVRKGALLAVFGAKTCRHCRDLVPALEAVEAALGHVVTVAQVDIDDAPETRRRLGIHAIPATRLFRRGVEIKNLGHRDTAEELIAGVRAALTGA
jgi:thioredoxin-like negative regulator of GroEL